MKSSLDCIHEECTHSEWCLFEYREYVASLLKKMRQDAKLTQHEVAERAGMHQPCVARMERGIHNTTLKSIEKYAAACGFRLSPKLVPYPTERVEGRS